MIIKTVLHFVSDIDNGRHVMLWCSETTESVFKQQNLLRFDSSQNTLDTNIHAKPFTKACARKTSFRHKVVFLQRMHGQVSFDKVSSRVMI